MLNYQFNERLDVSANWIYNTGQPITYPYATYTVNGVTYSVYNGYRNQSRYPDYHRLDFSMTWKGKQRERWQDEWNLSIYNVYGRHNTWAVTVTTDDDNKIKNDFLTGESGLDLRCGANLGTTSLKSAFGLSL